MGLILCSGPEILYVPWQKILADAPLSIKTEEDDLLEKGYLLKDNWSQKLLQFGNGMLRRDQFIENLTIQGKKVGIEVKEIHKEKALTNQQELAESVMFKAGEKMKNGIWDPKAMYLEGTQLPVYLASAQVPPQTSLNRFSVGDHVTFKDKNG